MRTPGQMRAIALTTVAVLLLAAPVSAKPILHWKFDESTGTTASDSAPDAGPDGGNNDGTLEDFPDPTDPRRVAGKAGKALKFAGGDTGNEELVVNNITDQTLNSYTVSLWSRTSNPGQQEFVSVFSSKRGIDGGSFIDTFQIDMDGSGKYRFLTDGNGKYSFGSVADDAWQHLAATVEGTSLNLYLDGTQSHTAGLLNHEGKLFQAYQAGANRGNNRFFTGLLDDIQLYDTALSGDQIEFLSDNPGSVIPEPAALALLALSGILILARRNMRC